MERRQENSRIYFGITSLEFQDEGTYTCVASNTIEAGARSSSTSVQLTIEGPPQRCVVLSVKSYIDSKVNVTVNCPENGNSSVTDYCIEYQVDSGTSNMQWEQREFSASSPQPYIVVCLSPFTKYRVRATASNRHGYEPGSLAAVNVVAVTTAEGYPGSPNSLSVLGNAFAHWFVVSWLPPSAPNGVPHYYFVYYKPIGVRQVSHTRLNVTAMWANLTMLTPFTQYSVEVAAVNVRSHDGKVLEGGRSTGIIVNTTEDEYTTASAENESSSLSGGVSNSVIIGVTVSVIILILIVILFISLRKKCRCIRYEGKLEPMKCDSKATSGMSECLEKRNEIMTVNVLYCMTNNKRHRIPKLIAPRG
ncbi:neural cell adhesion molecule L1-like isoform X2 [Corticium candelabrum]|uniref:neural cell adhesion molecule L1-like isoform X2 n=1 Tax=Corticium candelabrum TaxID=121492 RepID=UPI002E26C55F|nr:neural cell adhesion molecule L1-like isoform X2 [Corticium candelabrum]